MLSLVHQLQGAFGNQLIVEDVNDADFFVSGMGGGGGADCLAGVGCVTDDDCADTDLRQRQQPLRRRSRMSWALVLESV